jgi:hypothetical protein
MSKKGTKKRKGPKSPMAARMTNARQTVRHQNAILKNMLRQREKERDDIELAQAFETAKGLHFHPSRWINGQACGYLVTDQGAATAFMLRAYERDGSWLGTVQTVKWSDDDPSKLVTEVLFDDEAEDEAEAVKLCMEFLMGEGEAFFEEIYKDEERFRAFSAVVMQGQAAVEQEAVKAEVDTE